MHLEERKYRQFLPESRRIVVKVGTRVIAQPSGRPVTRLMDGLARQIAGLRRKGYEVVLVTSGAIGAGMDSLGIAKRPTDVPDLQMCAAVGQARLMATYEQLFKAHHIKVGQVLLTHADFKHRIRFANARRTLENLLRHGVLPIVNENDVVADEEVKASLSLGDNDHLAALVVKMVRADLLVMLTTVDGVLAPAAGNRHRRIPYIESLTPEILKLVNPSSGGISKGGMDSKLQAAKIASRAGCSVLIANGRTPGILQKAVAGEDVGTLFLANIL